MRKIPYLLLLGGLSSLINNVYAMDLHASHAAEPKDINYSNAQLEEFNDDLKYPSKISFILGYSTITVKNSGINNYAVAYSPQGAVTQLTSSKKRLSGLKIGLTQLITKHFGYEANINYYFPGKSNKTFSDNYDGAPNNIVVSQAHRKTTAMTAELLGIAALHLTDSLALVGKLGLGYEKIQTVTSSSASFSELTPTYVPLADQDNHTGFGLATGIELRYDFNENVGITLGANYLLAKQHIIAYNAGLLLRL